MKPALLVLLLWASQALAASPEDARGLWFTAQKDAMLEFAPCTDRPASLCGRIVWDKDAGTPVDTCGFQIARFDRWADGAWRDGWAFDPRDKKKYRATLRVKEGLLHLRAFVGVEVLGQTEQFTRAQTLPATPACKS
jgi:uncharacterized protein (DUF2147 family)